ncbi:MAG TPA: C25 family cysteine peptidase [Bacteroidales bacterium]|nr:C25 family cysteine peptidase [Bacteroidales bacterium]HQG62411.1 C25 family cysteine peptidase [Bacteroidales bacterium]HQK66816.1 C25 family cysteine peptidase [Bacteroidales bacterium]
MHFNASENSLTVEYSISNPDLVGFSDENGTFYRIIIPGHIPAVATGKPEIPVLSRLITVPDDFSYKIKISDVRSSEINPARLKIKGILFPAQEGETKEPQKKKQFSFDKAVYASREFIKTDTVTIEPAGRLRNINLATLTISPVRYNPSSNLLNVITSMKIEIIFSGSKSLTPVSPALSKLLEKGIANYYPDDVIPGYTDKPVRMVILTDTTFRKYLDPLIEWKTLKGFKTEVLYRGEKYAGQDYTAIKNTLTNIYNASSKENPPPEYLLIIGDVTKIPRCGVSQVTDLYYGEFDGNGDYIPEMFIGRLPVKDTTELKSVIKKIVEYERFEFADTNRFYENSLVTAGYDGTYYPYMNEQLKYAVSNYLTASNKIKEFHFYYPQTQPAHEDSVKKIINKGVSFLNYSGHGSVSGWLHLNIDTSDVRKLTNNKMYPLVVSNACLTSKFDVASLGNKMVLSKNKGAIGFIGCSNDSFWNEDFYWSVGLGIPSENPTYETTGLGFYDRLFHTHGENASDWYFAMGQMNFAGNLAVSASNSPRKKYYWETYNLVGDPSIIPVIGIPEEFNINFPDTLPPGITSLSFLSEPFSYAALSDFKNLWDASYASPSGLVTLEMPALKGDSCLLVVTGQNRKPLIKTIYFSGINGEFINMTKAGIEDIKGNNNGLADYGESIYLALTINNYGNKDATNLSARMTTTSPWVTVNKGTVNIGTLGAGKQIVISNDLEFTLAREIPDKGVITLDLILKDDRTEKHYKIDVTVHAPELKILSCVINDAGTGNGDLIADPGETFSLVFRIRNDGSSNIAGVINLNTPDDGVSILEPSKNSGELIAGETFEIPVLIRLSQTVGSGSTITVKAFLDCDPYFVNKDFSFRVGRIRESFESSNFSLFPWINLSSQPWTITKSGSADGIMAAKSGAISHSSSSSLVIRTYYEKDDIIKFYTRVSSEQDCDFLIFRLNDKEIFRLSGEIPWELKSVPLTAGYNKLEWIYKKDMSISSGGDYAMIDMIDFTVSGTVRYIEKDLITGRIISPVQEDNLGREQVTVNLVNLGPKAISGFNLAYTIDNKPPVIQHFDNNLIPSLDSVSVTFNALANLSRYGIYDITVYSLDNDDENPFNDTLSVRIENNKLDEPLLIFPNPFTDELNLVINSKAEGTVRITLFSSLGKKILDYELPVTEGMNETVISDNRLIPAVYYLRVTSPEATITLPVVKMRR